MNKIESMIAFFTDAIDCVYIESIELERLVDILKEVNDLPEDADYETLSETIMETI